MRTNWIAIPSMALGIGNWSMRDGGKEIEIKPGVPGELVGVSSNRECLMS